MEDALQVPSRDFSFVQDLPGLPRFSGFGQALFNVAEQPQPMFQEKESHEAHMTTLLGGSGVGMLKGEMSRLSSCVLRLWEKEYSEEEVTEYLYKGTFDQVKVKPRNSLTPIKRGLEAIKRMNQAYKGEVGYEDFHNDL
ncbi:MAG: hypothetical protein Q9178_002800 [Gyalolechia marmorata]